MHKALFYEPFKKDIVKCTLCPHLCLIQNGNSGACAIRQNRDGTLYTLVYGKAIACHADPIEKKPLFHFFPGSKIYSYATAGCNFKCAFCQNWDISQISKGKEGHVNGQSKSAQQIVEEAIAYGCISVAMTYNEPSIQFEYALDCCKAAKKEKLKSVFVSNGYINKEAIDLLAPYLDAINIDLKSFSDDYYKRVCGARLQPVLDAIKHYHSKGIWMEITTLVIPGENDTSAELERIAQFIANLDTKIPWHVSRFHPDYHMTETPVTPTKTLHRAYQIGKKSGLEYVYLGNVPGDSFEHTYCPHCSKCLVERFMFTVTQNNIIKGRCRYCRHAISGRFS